MSQMNKIKALELLEKQYEKANIPIFGICMKIQQQENRGESFPVAYYKTAIRGLSISRRIYDNDAVPEIGACAWFFTRNVDLHKQKLYIGLYDEMKKFPRERLGNGILCIGYVSKVENNSLIMQIAPDISVPITNYDKAYLSYLPEYLDLCAARLNTEDGLNFTATVVAVEQHQHDERSENFELYEQYLPKSLQADQIIISNETAALIETTTKRPDMPVELMQAEIAEAYNESKAENAIIFDAVGNKTEDYTITFVYKDLRDVTADGARLFIGMHPDLKGASTEKWVVSFCGVRSNRMDKLFKAHVDVKNKTAMYETLRDLALPEKWDTKNKPLEILKNYFAYTYYNVWMRDLIYEFEDDAGKKMALFNTGLVNIAYKPLFCLLQEQKITSIKTHRWLFLGFATPGERELGKLITKWVHNDKLPKRVKYIHNLQDLFFDTSAPINVDFAHIVIDNMDRLPPDMFLEQARGKFYDEVNPIVEELKSKNPGIQKQAIAKMRNYLEGNEAYKRDIYTFIDSAVETARLRTEWNYRTAVPVYYVARNSISLLLPLSLREGKGEKKPSNVALVVSKQPSGNYQGETVFSMKAAYIDSRIICRPDSDWLSPDMITDDSEDET